MEFEDILELTGGYGKFQQKKLFLLVLPQVFVLSWIFMKPIFILSVPRHWCNVPELLLSNLSITAQRTIISPTTDPACSMYNVSYTKMVEEGHFETPNGSRTIPCRAGWQYDTEFYEETAATKWNMVCEFNYLPSLMYTLGNVGTLIGAPIFTYLSDKFGRRNIFIFLIALSIVIEIAYTLSYNIVMFAVVRLLHGALLPSIYTVPLVLTLELAVPKMRGHINVLTNLYWTVGLCALPYVAYLTRKWTRLCYLTAGIQFIFLCCFRFIPESPRWLISQGKVEDATNMLMKIAIENGKTTTKEELSKNLKILNKTEQKKKEGNSKPHAIFFYPRIRKNLFVLTFAWFAYRHMIFGVLSYNIINLNGNEFINFLLMCVVEFPGTLVFWYAMNKFGRRWTVVLGYFMAGVCSLLPITGLNNGAIISTMMVKFIGIGLIMVSDQQGAELLPTAARSFGLGAGKTIATAFGLLCPFIAYLGLYGKSLPFVVISATCFITCILSSLLPETLNENLPDTMLDAELLGEGRQFFSWKRSKSKVKDNQGTSENNGPPICDIPD